MRLIDYFLFIGAPITGVMLLAIWLVGPFWWGAGLLAGIAVSGLLSKIPNVESRLRGRPGTFGLYSDD